MPTGGIGFSYIPRLDSFRAIAALLIVHAHYFNNLLPKQMQVNTTFGISFFFVLSGFLITTLLIEDTGPKSRILGSFYIRRAFRIFPLYYLVIGLGLLLSVPGFRESTPWSLFYLTNFAMAANDSWFGYASHLWTLAVEEQFYLIWPVILLLLGPRTWIIVVPWIIACIVFRYMYRGPIFDYLNLLGNGDFLMMGALAAQACQKFGAASVERALRIPGLLSIPFLVMQSTHGLYPIMSGSFHMGIGLPAAAVVFVWLIVMAVRDGPKSSSWGGRWLPFLGTISYGIYVWHMPFLWPVSKLEGMGFPAFPVRVVTVAVVLLVSWLSYRFFETPLRQYGRRLAVQFERSKALAPTSAPA